MSGAGFEVDPLPFDGFRTCQDHMEIGVVESRRDLVQPLGSNQDARLSRDEDVSKPNKIAGHVMLDDVGQIGFAGDVTQEDRNRCHDAEF